METSTPQTVETNVATPLASAPDPSNAILFSQIRHIVTLLAGVAVTRGFVDASWVEIIISVVMFIATLVWSILEKKGHSAELLHAVSIANSLMLDQDEVAHIVKTLSGPDANGQARAASQNSSLVATAPSSQPAPGASIGGAPGFVLPELVGLVLAVASGIAIIVFTLACAGCSSTQQAKFQADTAAIGASLGKALTSPTAHALEADALQIGLQLAVSAISKGSIESAWTSPTALNSLEMSVAQVGISEGAQLISSTVQSFAPKDPIVANAAGQLATAYATRLNTGGTPGATLKAAAVVALANGVSAGLTKATPPDVPDAVPKITRAKFLLSIPPSLVPSLFPLPAREPKLRALPLPELREETPSTWVNDEGGLIYFVKAGAPSLLIRGEASR